MSVMKAYAGGEGFISVADRAERRRQKTVDRLAAGVVKAAGEDRMQYSVRNGWRDMFGTTNEPKIYEAVAKQLGEADEPIEIEATRFTGQKHKPVSLESPLVEGPETIYAYDVIRVTSIGGAAIQHEPHRGPDTETETRLYPPEDLDGQHNLAMMG